jgi:hypothetical protein
MPDRRLVHLMRLNPACKRKDWAPSQLQRAKTEWLDFYMHRNFGIQANG